VAKPAALLVAFIVLLALAVQGRRDEVWEETLTQADGEGFDYLREFRAAKRAEPESIYRLLMFTGRTDAAGAIGHGIALMEVAEAAGDAVFSEQVRRLTPQARRWIPHMLASGLSYGRWRDDRAQAAAIRYPRTTAASMGRDP